MTSPTWVKRYDSLDRCDAARRHLSWLTGLDSGVRLPALHASGPRQLTFEHLGNHHPDPEHLDLLADTLGRLHAAAYTCDTHRAHLDRPFRTGDLAIADFLSPRREALRKVHVDTHRQPAALYKDANIRNFLLTDTGVAVVDFDDLTLAPFGYDLAKLIVTTAMTHGPLDQEAIDSALHTYNRRTAHVTPSATCPLDRLFVFADIHHLLTARYLGRHGYRHAWPDVRPPVARTP